MRGHFKEVKVGHELEWKKVTSNHSESQDEYDEPTPRHCIVKLQKTNAKRKS